MKHASVWLMALALSLPVASKVEGKTMTKDDEKVLAAVQEMTRAFEGKDIDRVMQSYEPGAIVAFEPDAPLSDHAQLAKMFSAMSQANPKFTYAKGHDVIISGDIAMHIAPWSMSAESTDGGGIAQSGLSVAILRKQSDGSWKMVIDNPHGGRLLTQDQE